MLPSFRTGSSVHTDYLGLFLPKSDVLCSRVTFECGLKTCMDAVFPYHACKTQLVKYLPAMRETWVQFLGWEVPLEKEMATHSSILVWRIPWTETPRRLQFTASQESDTAERCLSFFPLQDHKTLTFEVDWGYNAAAGEQKWRMWEGKGSLSLVPPDPTSLRKMYPFISVASISSPSLFG